MNTTIAEWKNSLRVLLEYYEAKRGRLYIFYPMLFLLFVLINIACYWWAMYTAFPELTRGTAGEHYFRVQFPVGFLGALFDSLSFFVTIFIIRHAIHAERDVQYITHLSLDLLIAILATFWVVFVFSFSGWIVQFWEPVQHVHQDLVNRNEEYTEMLVDSLERPTDNKRNIYFGLIMGVSAILPTCCHISMFLMSLYRTMFLRKA